MNTLAIAPADIKSGTSSEGSMREVATQRLPRGFWHRSRFARILRRLAAFLCLAAALALLTTLYVKSTAAGPEVRAEIEAILRQIRQDDAEWNAETLRNKLGIAEDYDAIVALDRRVRRRLEMLANHPATIGEFQKALQELAVAFKIKAERTDRFKSHNSILRNSLRYLPTAGAEARIAAQRLPSLMSRDVDASLASALTESLKYAVVADDVHRSSMMETLDHLTRQLDGIPQGELKDALTTFVAHAKTVLRLKGDEEALLAGVTDSPTGLALEGAFKRFDASAAAQISAADFWRSILAAYGAILVALAAIFAWRLGSSYVALNRANTALSTANDTLEARVLARTRELEAAIKSLKDSEAQLVQSEKMSSLGQMVAGVAHEINTPLAYVRSNLELLGERAAVCDALAVQAADLIARLQFPDKDPDALNACFQSVAHMTHEIAGDGTGREIQQLARDSVHGVGQISEIVMNLKNFSRLDLAKTTWFDVREGLESTLVIARNVVKSHHVVRDFHDIPQIEGSPSQLNQVFLNLITNAAQALPAAGGIMTLRTRTEDSQVRIDVADNGKGIAPDHLPKIFDPFFTTKPAGEGTGLGLAIAYKIVASHGGRIAVDSKLGTGTTFSVILPARRPRNQTSMRRQAPLKSPTRSQVIPSSILA